MARLRFTAKVTGSAAAFGFVFAAASFWLQPGWRFFVLDVVLTGALVVLSGVAWMLDVLVSDPFTRDRVVRRLADALLAGGRTSLRETGPHHVAR